ncbi:MAG: hypothetical protein K2H69_04455 [Alistipes sp.]|nr:hypothetical protein [Alistipes sp.]
MKKIISVLAATLFACTLSAQTPTAYFMEGSTFRSQLNPAFAPLRGYVNIPVLGGVQIEGSGNLAVGKLFYPRQGSLVTLFDKSVPTATALGKLRARNVFGLDTRVNLIGFGAYTRNGKNFWSFDLNLRNEAEIDLPYGLFEFVKTGAERASIRNVAVTDQAFVEAGFNYSFPLTEKIYLGARGKFLVGGARARVAVDRLDVALEEDRWSVEADGVFETSGIEFAAQTREDGSEYYSFDGLGRASYEGPAGYGFAVDLGVTYDVLPDLQLSMAVNDLGFIAWGKRQSSLGRMSKAQSFEGVEIVGGEVTRPEFDFGELEFDRENPARGRTDMLRTSINVGAEYEVWRHKIGLGLLYNVRVWDSRSFHNLTASVNFHPVRWFTLTGSYSMLNGRAHAMGLAINACPSWINFFLATDLLVCKHTPQWLPINSTSMNVTLGLGIPIGRRGRRIEAYNEYRWKRSEYRMKR